MSASFFSCQNYLDKAAVIAPPLNHMLLLPLLPPPAPRHLARLSIFNNPHHARFDMGEIGSNWVAALLRHSFLVNSPVRGDPRIEVRRYPHECAACLTELYTLTSPAVPLACTCACLRF